MPVTMSNMAIEAGGKNGLIACDEKTEAYLKKQSRPENITLYYSDPDAEYARVIEYDVSKIEPQVAFPHLPENTRTCQ